MFELNTVDASGSEQYANSIAELTRNKHNKLQIDK